MSVELEQFDFSHAFQRKLVRLLFQFPQETGDILNMLQPQLFDLEPLQWCVRKLRWCAARGMAPTITTLGHELVKDATRGLVSRPFVDVYAQSVAMLRKPVADKTYVLEQAHEYVRRQLLRKLVVVSGRALRDGALIDWQHVTQDMEAVRQVGEFSEGGLGQDYCADLRARIQRRRNFERLGIPTGIRKLDASMRHGGLPPKQIGVVVAPTGRGKTATLASFCCQALRYGEPVLYLSLELDEDMIADRIDANVSGIEMSLLDKKSRLVRTLVSRRLAKWGGNLRIKFFDPGALTLAGLEAYLKRLEADSFYPGLVLLDYADNLSLTEFGGYSSDRDYEPLGRMYKALRGLACRRNLRIWTASQANREGSEAQEVRIKHVADSLKKMMVADVAISLGRPAAGTGSGMLTLSVLKNRNGPTISPFPVHYKPGIASVLD
jgi:hypothetical protein